jgi:hypothetical protein
MVYLGTNLVSEPYFARVFFILRLVLLWEIFEQKYQAKHRFAKDSG